MARLDMAIFPADTERARWSEMFRVTATGTGGTGPNATLSQFDLADLNAAIEEALAADRTSALATLDPRAFSSLFVISAVAEREDPEAVRAAADRLVEAAMELRRLGVTCAVGLIGEVQEDSTLPPATIQGGRNLRPLTIRGGR